ncbi:MAG: hypothetical protein ACI977_000049 [Candidatus Nanohaloarchaea archaeon]|jgi:hypothetical protein
MNARKAQNMSVSTMSKIVLVLLIIAAVYAAFNGWFTELASGFVDSIVFPDV